MSQSSAWAREKREHNRKYNKNKNKKKIPGKVANFKSPFLTIVLFGSRGSTEREKEDNKWVL
jgi:hypothetical protein